MACMHEDALMFDGHVAAPDVGAALPGNEFLFKQALLVPGMNHIVANAESQADKGFAYWPTYVKQLQAVVKWSSIQDLAVGACVSMCSNTRIDRLSGWCTY